MSLNVQITSYNPHLGLLRSELCRVNTEQSTRAVARPASLRHQSGVGPTWETLLPEVISKHWPTSQDSSRHNPDSFRLAPTIREVFRGGSNRDTKCSHLLRIARHVYQAEPFDGGTLQAIGITFLCDNRVYGHGTGRDDTKRTQIRKYRDDDPYTIQHHPAL